MLKLNLHYKMKKKVIGNAKTSPFNSSFKILHNVIRKFIIKLLQHWRKMKNFSNFQCTPNDKGNIQPGSINLTALLMHSYTFNRVAACGTASCLINTKWLFITIHKSKGQPRIQLTKKKQYFSIL